MAGGWIRRGFPHALVVAGVGSLCSLWSPRAMAIEALDGRIQAHGFAEVQIRAIDSRFREELDLSQWYNVLNVELEFDILPDGWGPFDLMSAFVRAEARYDCIYTHGCGIFPSVDSFGDDSDRLPERLRDARDPDYAGVIPIGKSVPRIPSSLLAANRFVLANPDEQSFEDLWADLLSGAEATLPPAQFEEWQRFLATVQKTEVALVEEGNLREGYYVTLWTPTNAGPRPVPLVGLRGLEPFGKIDQNTGLPRNFRPGWPYPLGNDAEGRPFCDPALGCPGEAGELIPSSLNPVAVKAIQKRVGFPGLDTLFEQAGADQIPNTADDPGIYVFGDKRLYEFGMKSFGGADGGAVTTETLGPWRPKDFVRSLALLKDKANPFRGRVPASKNSVWEYGVRWNAIRYNERTMGIPAGYPEAFIDPFPEELLGFIDFDPYEVWNNTWGGDYSGIVPCTEPDRAASGPLTNFQRQIDGSNKVLGCIPFTNIRVTGGTGELPLRPGPDRSNLSSDFDYSVAQGLYYPSKGLRDYLLGGGDFDSHEFNLREAERAWNRGASQQETKELKEAYLDVEFLDSRLWARIGLQSIVWGKTELFRTTDQFNPQDLALASLPSLEESRISLWSARFVYSLYNVGPLEDVRVELAGNFGRYKSADLGACGEPYTFNVVCGITTGLFAHSFAGVGVAGVDRPPHCWEDPAGCEIGGRIEWRWDRFSFAVTDFYGYDDFPFPDAIEFYDRGVEFALADLETREFALGAGRPLVAGARGRCSGAAGSDGERIWASANRDSRLYASMSVAGIGRDPACLKPGGAAGQLNQNGFTVRRAFTPADLARYELDAPGDIVFVGVDPVTGNPVSSIPIAEWDGLALELAEYALPWNYQPINCAPGEHPEDPNDGSPLNCEPLRYQMGVNEPYYREIYPDGLSPENALENHPANQTSFAWICTMTLTIGASIDAGACAWTLFGSPERLIKTSGTVGNPPFVEVMACVLAGEIDASCVNFLNLVSNNLQEERTLRPAGLVPLNRDANDGRITALNESVNRDSAADLLNPATACAVYSDPTQFNLCVANVTAYNTYVRPYLPGPNDMLTLDSALTAEQRALLGCGPYYGTRCDTARDATALSVFGFGYVSLLGTGGTLTGGLDFLNMEAIALLQSFIGIEGTALSDPIYREIAGGVWAPDSALYAGTEFEGQGVWLTTSGLPQPGTIEFLGGPGCTRFVKELNDTIVLPGCRGANAILARTRTEVSPGVYEGSVLIQFDAGYDPAIDGCVVGETIGGVDVEGVYADGSPVDLSSCFAAPALGGSDHKEGQRWGTNTIPGRSLVISGSGTLWHPFAGCFSRKEVYDGESGEWVTVSGPEVALSGAECVAVDTAFLQQLPDDVGRDFETNFFCDPNDPDDPDCSVQRVVSCDPTDPDDPDCDPDTELSEVFYSGQSQIFRSELAAFSWNFQQFLVQSSCDIDEDDIVNDPECFNPATPYAVGKCSWVTPQFCLNVKAFFSAAGVMRNTVRAGGNKRFGRRTFIWQSGGEVVLRYEKRNVLGFSMDFAEDVTKTNWGVEFTWIEGNNFIDNDAYDGISRSDTLNLTVSVDRPTFINFLNANRTFFMNSQWFFQYIPDHEKNFLANGPFNVLFTVAVFTGYFQDRLNPSLVTVYDFNSRSGAILPSVNYRFTEALSVTVGVSLFFGRTELRDMPINPIAPAANRAGPEAYKSGTDNLLSNFRDKDEVWLNLRWTF